LWVRADNNIGRSCEFLEATSRNAALRELQLYPLLTIQADAFAHEAAEPGKNWQSLGTAGGVAPAGFLLRGKPKAGSPITYGILQ
jgi:hypothetical protein